MRPYVCMCVCVGGVCECVFQCVFSQDNSKRNQSRNMKFKYFVVYEYNSKSSILSD